MGVKLTSLTLREEHASRMRLIENSVLRICGLKREEVIGGWRKLHNKEFNYLHSSSNIIKEVKSRITWASNVAHRGEMTNP
jgi:hypothetical protein